MRKFLMTSLAAVLTLALALVPVPAVAQGISQPIYTTYVAGAAYTNATTGFTSVVGGTANGGLSFPVAASQTYHANCYITWQGSANTTGPKYQFTGPGSPTAVVLGVFSNITSSTYTAGVVTAFATPFANAGTVTATTNFTDWVALTVVNGANAGTVVLQMAANGAGTLTVQPGSYCIWQ